MANHYKQLADKLIDIFSDNRTTNLSTGLSENVVSVNKGHFVPTSESAKPCVYVRPEFPSFIAELAGGLSQLRGLTFCIDFAVASTSRDTAWDDALILAGNIENLLLHNQHVDGYWTGGHLGVGGGDENSPEPYGAWKPAESTGTRVVVHGSIRFTVHARIGREALV